MQPDPIYDDAFEFDPHTGEFDLSAYDSDDTDGEIASIVAAFDPVFEPELLVEYLRVWAASSRTHAADLFDHVVSIEMESVASLDVHRVIETRAERVIQAPGNAVLPQHTYTGPIAHATDIARAEFTDATIEARRAGTERPVACSCRHGGVACHACNATGSTSAGGCVVCNTTGSVAHSTCGGAGVLVEYTHGTVTRRVETTWTVSRRSRGLDHASARDWWHTDVDPASVLALMPHESAAPLHAAWHHDAQNTIARHGTLSALPIYRVVFRRRGRERSAWLIGSQLRVVVPGRVGRTPDWLVKRAFKVGATVMSLMSAWLWWQSHTSAPPHAPAPNAPAQASTAPERAPTTVQVPSPLKRSH